MAQPDLTAFQRAKSFTDFDKQAIEEARQRYVQAQALQMQQQAAKRQQEMLELDRQKFEAEKAAPGALFGGNSFQAQLGNQMKAMGYSDQQIVEALTTKGIPLQDGGYATYSPVGMLGRPAGQPQAQPQALEAPAATGLPATQPNIEAILNAMPSTTGAPAGSQQPSRIRPGINVLVEGGMKEAEVRDRMSAASKAETQASEAIKVIDALIDERGNLRPQAQSSVGGIGGIEGRIASVMPVTENQRRTQPYIEQLKGQAFLQAFESLKGGGQITQIEGEKATNAILRLQQYQSEADFAAALKDLRDVVEVGLQRARQSKAELGGDGMAAAPEQITTQPADGVRITSDADYDALPSGATFFGPDGVLRRKP